MQGLGLAIARYIVDTGHNVVVTARSKTALEVGEPGISRILNRLILVKSFQTGLPKQVRTVTGDITDPIIATKVAEAAKSSFGQIDGLVINHGIMDPVARIADGEAEEWKKCFDINLFSAISLVKLLLVYWFQPKLTIISSRQHYLYYANRKVE